MKVPSERDGGRAGVLHGSPAELLGQGQDAQDAAHAQLAVLVMDLLEERADLRSRAAGAGEPKR
jgi:hypothetical protein